MIDRSKKRNGLARKNKKQVFVTYVFHCLSFVFAWLFLFVNFVFVFLHMIPFQQNVKLKKLVEKDVKKNRGKKSDTERANSSFLFNLWSSGLFVLQCSFQSKLVGATHNNSCCFELNNASALVKCLLVVCEPSTFGVDPFFLRTCPCLLLKTKQTYPAMSGLPVVFFHTFS